MQNPTDIFMEENNVGLTCETESPLLNPARDSRNRYPVKYSFIFLFLALFVLCFMLYNMDFNDSRSCTSAGKSCVLTELKKKLSDIMAPKPASVTSMTTALPSNMTSIHPSEPPSACSFHAVSPEDAQELAMIMESIAWPETPPLLSNLSLENTSDPAHSTFTILPRNGGGSWQIGDQLEVLIKMFDFNGRPKRSGGDVLYARLANRALYAGVAGKVFDHHNGSYTAVFSLLWEGTAQVEVTLVHPSEAVTLLEKVTKEEPGRAYSLSVFRSGSVTETVRCNVCLEGPKQKLCNYTDLHTGEPWFCYKPKKLNCDMRVTHSRGGFTQIKQPMEDQLLQLGVNMKVSISASGPASINILPKPKGGANENLKTTPAGYYYQGVWRALDGTTVHQFSNATAISQCLKGKMVHLYGDSTVRQWFEYLIANTPDLQKFDLKSPPRAGPYMALDYKRNILVTYRCHGTPIFFTPMSVSETHYITSELRGVVGGTNTVIIIAVWAHFSTFPVEVYIRRLLNIRRAVELLLSRAPGTLVIIRTGNPKTLKASEARIGSDWYSLQRDKILRAIFKGVKVRLVDAWEMCLAHHLPHSLHPQPPIIKNMIDVVLSHICSPGGNSKLATKKSKEKN